MLGGSGGGQGWRGWGPGGLWVPEGLGHRLQSQAPLKNGPLAHTPCPSGSLNLICLLRVIIMMTLGLGVRAEEDPHLPPLNPSTSPPQPDSGRKCAHSGLPPSPRRSAAGLPKVVSAFVCQAPPVRRHRSLQRSALTLLLRVAAFSWAPAHPSRTCRPQLSPEPVPSLPLLTALHGGGSCLPRPCPFCFR